MKKDTHPEYKEVVFLDMSTGKKFLCRSSAEAKDTIDFEGQTYPCVKVSISSSSHPFFTGDQKFVDTQGRVDKFKKRYEAKPVEPKAAKKEEASEEDKKSAKKASAPKKQAAAASKTAAKKTAVKKKED